LVDIVLGIIGGWVFGMLGSRPGRGIIGSIIVGFIGAVILAWITRLLKKALTFSFKKRPASALTSARATHGWSGVKAKRTGRVYIYWPFGHFPNI
jgi:hypothetical protein